MANLGNIWFNLNLKDDTSKDLDKIMKELEKKNIKLNVDVDKDKLISTLQEAAKGSSSSKKNFEELAKTLGVTTEQAASMVANIKRANAEEISLLNNTERMTKAKEKLLELERAVVLRQMDQTKEGKKILAWTKEAKAALETVDLTDKTAVIKAAGADLSAQINIRKDLMRHTTKAMNEDIKANRSVEASNLSIEKALLRIAKIRDRIKNDPFREQEGYVGVNQELDKMRVKLESMKGKTRGQTRSYLAIDFNKEVQGIENLIKKQDQLHRVTEKQTSTMGRMWNQMGNQVKSVLSIYALQRFTRQLIEMGGEFEKQHFALRAIIGDMGKADQIFNNLKKVAVKSPFHFGDFTGFAKQLAAFSIPVNEIYDTTKRLADVSAGLGVDMGRIILAYGQIRSASFLRGQEVRQLTEAGIPIIEELSKKLTELRGQVVSTSEVFDSISRREVPFEMVKEIFQDLTNEGGKFYNMQEILAESLSGKWANLTSHYQIMLYDMSQSNRGYLNSLIEVLTGLVKNFRLVESAITGLLSAYVLGRVVKLAGEFKGLNNLLVNLGSNLKNIAKKYFTGTNLIVGGLSALIASISYVTAKTNVHREKIDEIISSTFELTDKFKSQVGALKELASASDTNKDALVERERILNKMSETEPEVAKEIRAHADDIEYLTEKVKEYIAAKQAARDVELGFEGESWLSDTMEDTENKLNKARNNIAKLNIVARKSFAELMMNLEGKELQNYMADKYGYAWSDEVIASLEKVLNDTNKKAEEKWREFNQIAYEYTKEDRGAGAASIFYRRISAIIRAEGDYSKAADKFNAKIDEANVTMVQSLANVFDKDGIEEGSDRFIEVIYNAIKGITSASDLVREALFKSFDIDPSAYENSTNALEGWRDEVNNIVKGIVTISKEDSIETVMSNISGEIDKIKKYLKGVDIAKLRAIVEGGGGTDAQKEAIINYDAQTSSLNKLLEAKTLLGISDDKEKPDNKDPFADKMERRIKLIEDAKAIYEKYIPILGKANALEKVQGDSRFASLKFSPDSFESSLKEVYGQLGNSDAQKKLKEQLEKTFSEIDFNKVKDGVDKFSKDLGKYITDNKERWGLFDKLFEQSGDYKTSFTLAFGAESDEEAENYIESLKNKIKEITSMDDEGLEALLGLDPDELESKYGKPIIDLINTIKDAIKKSKEDIMLSDVKAIAEVATLEEKANSIRGKYAKSMDEAGSEKARLAYAELMNEELSDLYSKAIELNPIWRELFGDVSDYSYRMLNNLVNKAKELLDTAEEVKDKDGRGTGMFKLTDKDSKEEYTITGEAYTRMLKNIGKKSEEIRQRNPFSAFAKSWKDFIDADKGDDKEKALTKLMLTAGMAADEVSNIASAFSDMFDSLGNEELADTIGLLGDFADAAGSIASGFAQGGMVGGITASLSAIPKVIGSIAKHHDKKLDRKIQKSANEVKRLQNAYERVNREVERQLGVMTKGQVDKQIESLKGQISQTYKMIDKERGKKKSDAGKIDDYKKQIEDLNDQLQYFYEDLAGQLYDINIKDWASQFSSSIMDAWRKGGDAALAYEKTANEVLASVANKMLAESIYEKVFEQLREALPDMLDKGHFDKEDLGVIANLLVNAGDQWEDATEMLDQLNEVVKEMSGGRYDLKIPDDLESNLGQGIQAMTEDTAQLLGSYLNAIRQDVSVKRDLLTKIAEAFDGSIVGNIATMAADIKKIESNTFRSANGVDSINDKLESVINGTKKFYTE